MSFHGTIFHTQYFLCGASCQIYAPLSLPLQLYLQKNAISFQSSWQIKNHVVFFNFRLSSPFLSWTHIPWHLFVGCDTLCLWTSTAQRNRITLCDFFFLFFFFFFIRNNDRDERFTTVSLFSQSINQESYRNLEVRTFWLIWIGNFKFITQHLQPCKGKKY